jgi:hypothetical protein
MSRGKSSGISLSNKDASIVLGMVARDDRDHDIAAWFGVNQGRIAEVKAGSHGSIPIAQPQDLPPKGSPGRKPHTLKFGIPQGSQISAILSNVYMLPFDEEMCAVATRIGGYPLRPSRCQADERASNTASG